MRYHLLLVAFMLSAAALTAQDISGNWKGNINVSGSSIPIVFHFTTDASGRTSGTWDSPKQHANGLPFSSIRTGHDSVHLDISMIAGSYQGALVGPDSIAGIWEQRGNQLPLNLSRSRGDTGTKTAPMYPGENEVSITSAAGTRLYGTLLARSTRQKLAIIVAGSGPTDRNGNSSIGAGTNEYEMLARSLDSQNIASFRYDKRGIAKSAVAGFKESDLVFEDYVKDAGKIFGYVQDTLGYQDIYFIGHSEGSLIAILASQKKNVKGYISVAGAGRPIDVILEEQIQRQPLPDSVKQQVPVIFDRLRNGKETDDFPEMLAPLFRKSIQPYMISWMKYDPSREIKKLHCPVLVLQGGCDIQVTTADAADLHSAAKKSILDIIPGMSHTLKDAGKDCAEENKTYTDGTMPLDRRLVEDIVQFIRK